MKEKLQLIRERDNFIGHPGKKTYRQTEEDAKKHLCRERILAVLRRRNCPKAIEAQVATSEMAPECRDSWPPRDSSIEDSPIVLRCHRRFRRPRRNLLLEDFPPHQRRCIDASPVGSEARNVRKECRRRHPAVQKDPDFRLRVKT